MNAPWNFISLSMHICWSVLSFAHRPEWSMRVPWLGVTTWAAMGLEWLVRLAGSGGIMLTCVQHDSAGPVALALHPHVPPAAEPGAHGPLLPIGQHVPQRVRVSTGWVPALWPQRNLQPGGTQGDPLRPACRHGAPPTGSQPNPCCSWARLPGPQDVTQAEPVP